MYGTGSKSPVAGSPAAKPLKGLREFITTASATLSRLENTAWAGAVAAQAFF